MKNIKKIILLAAMLVLMVFVLSGCGAKVSGTMTIDENFAGKRDIIVALDSDDLSHVTGGIGGLENVIKGSIPPEMTYAIANNQITFTIEYKDINDYRNKVTKIIAAGVTESEKAEESHIVPEIIYERNESYFKKGILFSENFTNIDLVDWYREALRTADIIDESESNWFEKGNNIVTIEGTEYDCGDKLSVEDQDNACISSCDVITEVMVDGTIEREIRFTADESIIEKLSEKGCELESYLKALSGENVAFTSESDDGSVDYIFTINASNAEDLVKKTNKVMQNENNKFSIETTLSEEQKGVANVSVSEVIDGSFYLDYNSRHPLSHTIKVYNNADFKGGVTGENEFEDVYDNEGSINYSPSSTAEYSFAFDWQIEFEKINFNVNLNSEDDVEVSFECEFSETLPEEMRKSAIERVKDFVDAEDCEETDEGITISLSGDVFTVSQKINDIFAKAASTQDAEDDEYFSISNINEFDTIALFTEGSSCEIFYDFTPLFGESDVFVEESDGFLSGKYYPSATTNDEGETYISACGSVSIYTKEADFVAIIIATFSLIVAVFGVIFALKNLDELKKFIAELKEKKTAAAQNASEETDAPQQEPQQEPQPQEPQETVDAQPSVPTQDTETNDDEEDIL